MQHVSIIKRSFEILHHTSLHCSMRTLPLYIFLAIMPPIFSKPNQLGIHIITRPRHHTKQFVRATLAEGLGITDGSSLKKNDDNGAGVTKTSKAMHATQDMYELSARLGSAEATAENVVDLLHQASSDLQSAEDEECRLDAFKKVRRAGIQTLHHRRVFGKAAVRTNGTSPIRC